MNRVWNIVPRIEKSSKIFLIVMLLFGAGLRFYHLNTGLWYDEIQTLLSSIRNPLQQIVSSFPSNNNHILYSVLANVCCAVFGEHAWSVRLPAVLFGLASLPMLFVVGSTVSNRFEALLATAILTVSYHHIWFSQNARGYTALLFFYMASTHLLVQWLCYRKKLNVLAYGLVIAFGAYAHLTMGFIVVTQAAVCAWSLLYEKRKTGTLRDWRPPVAAFALGGLLTFVLYSPVLSDMTEFFSSTSGTPMVATPVWAVLAALKGLQLGFGASSIALIGGLVFLAGVLSYFKERPSMICLFLLPAPVTLALAVAMGRPIFPRFLFFLIGFVLLIVIRGAVAIGHWVSSRLVPGSIAAGLGPGLGVLLALAAILFSLNSLPAGYARPKQDYLGAREFLTKTQQKRDLLVCVGITSIVPFQDYFGMPCLRVNTAEQLLAAQSQSDSLLLILTFPVYIETGRPKLWQMIQDHYREIGLFRGTVAGGDIHVYRFKAAPASQRPLTR